MHRFYARFHYRFQASLRLACACAAAGAIASTASCSELVDKNEVQCTQDSDCVHFGDHPSCQEGVCVSSGLGPDGCFFGTPMAQPDFANQCTTAKTYQFDNCARLGLCDPNALASALTVTATPASLGTVPPPVTNETTPTENCADVAANVIYITGSTNLPPLIKAVQPLLSAGSPPYTAIFAPQTSCKGAASVYDGSAAKHIVTNVANNYAFYYDSTGAQNYCLLAGSGNLVDVGESDVYPTSCDATYIDQDGVADYAGPIQAITFVVPSASTQTAISAEAAHLVFAAGGHGVATPWTDPTLYFVRSSGTGTIQLPSRAIEITPTAWWGLDRLSAGNLVASMEAVDPTSSEGSIGVLSNDFADRNRANLRTLAFQQAGQTFGYLPDSTPETFDKVNVRDGHYPIWGPVHLLAVTQNGVPSQAASALITQFSVPKLDETLVAAVIGAGFVPSCAMKVMRDTEVGPLSVYQPPFGCSCYYDNTITGTSSCQVCTTSSDCPSATPACNYGFCEVQ
jgi:ABC-type phosphate transport system substrate-binding protein